MEFTWGRAMLLLKNGKKVKRKGWINKFLFFDEKSNEVYIGKIIEEVTGKRVVEKKIYCFISRDRFQHDWVEV